MAVTDLFAGEITTEILKQLILISAKSWKYKSIADKLIDLIENIQPTIKEIQYRSVELPPHCQAQIGMLSITLEKGKKLTEKVLSSRRWNMYRQYTLARKMERLEKSISDFLKNQILARILADVHFLRSNSDLRVDPVDRSLEKMTEQLGSMKIRGGGMIRDAMKIAEATMEIETNNDSEMMLNDEGGLFGISGMGGVGKTTLARELERDDEVRSHFENRILFLTVSQSSTLEELRTHILGFLSGYEGVNPVPNWNLQYDGGVKTQKLVILDDVWTREALDRLTYNIPGCTTLVVSRSKLTEPKATYDVEMLMEDEAISPFCLCAFSQKSVPPGFSKSLVKQVSPPQHQVFINFRGEQLRNNFISHLVEALRRNEINVFIDFQELRGEDISILLKRIEDSRIALVVFSSKYTESRWCLREVAKIKDCVEQGMLKVLPIFYKVTTSNVKQLKGEFGDHFRDREWEYRFDKPKIEKWKEALAFISGKLGLTFDEKSSSESNFIGSIVNEVLRLLASIPSTAQSVSS